jgi:predicted dehydrogenase
MEQQPIRFGVIGCGLVSDFHGRAINGAAEGVLVAAADAIPERAQAFVEKYGGEAMPTIESLLSREDVDVINVLTPNATHGEYVIQAAQAGKHVIVEKPPDMTLARVDQMLAAADEAGVKLAVSLQVRLRKAIRAMKAAAEAGRFGRLLQGDAYMKWYRSKEYYTQAAWRSSRAQGAGVTIQHAFHYLDLLLHLLGPVRRVQAWMWNAVHPEVQLEDTAVALFEFENGARGLLEASTAFYPGTDIRIEVNGEKGTAIMQGERITAWQFAEEAAGDDAIRATGSEAIRTAAGGAADFAHFEHQYLIEDFIAAIREGRDPYVTVRSARHSLEVALAMYQSAETGEVVELPLADYVL